MGKENNVAFLAYIYGIGAASYYLLFYTPSALFFKIYCI